MSLRRSVQVVDTHTAGEPLRVASRNVVDMPAGLVYCQMWPYYRDGIRCWEKIPVF